MRKEPDIRVLCCSCKYDYLYAGYRVKAVKVKYKEEYDKCRFRMGWTYILIPPRK